MGSKRKRRRRKKKAEEESSADVEAFGVDLGDLNVISPDQVGSVTPGTWEGDDEEE